MKVFIFQLAFLTIVNYSHANFKFAPENIERYSNLQFTWWGFKIYKAEIWTPEAKKPDLNNNLLLHIKYQKDIKASKLVSTTRDQWKRLNLLRPKSEKWLKELSNIWPDIKSGDSLTTYSNGKVTFFYQGQKLLGSVKDEQFGALFLQIWLHKDSETSDLLKRTK